MELPPLPCTHIVVDGLWEDAFGPYSQDDMRAYATAAVTAERERCAKMCEEVGTWAGTTWRASALECAHQVRLKA